MRNYLSYISIAIMAVVGCTGEPVETIGISGTSGFAGEICASKTSLVSVADLYSINWEEGDEVVIGDGTSYARYKAVESGSSTTDFEFVSGTSLLDEGATYTSIYPYCDGGNYIFPENQKYREDGPDRYPMIAKSTNKYLRYFNPAGILKLNVKMDRGATTISSIALFATSSISGEAQADFDNVSLKIVNNGSNMILLDCGEGVEISDAKSVPFYFVMPEGKYDLSVYIETISGGVQVVDMDKEVTIEKSSLTSESISASPTAIAVDQCYGRANCFIASPGEALTFSVAAHNVAEDFTASYDMVAAGAPKAESAELVWSEFSGNVALNLDAAKQELTVTTPSGEYGNALVAIKNGDEILWSFHIWVPEDDPTKTLTYNNFAPKLNPEVMPLYIGGTKKAYSTSSDAEKIKCVGLYYQWGRKDPFKRITAFSPSDQSTNKLPSILPSTLFKDATGSQSTYALDYSTKHPDTVIPWVSGWAWFGQTKVNFWKEDVKTAYDPCPEGYKVIETKAFPSGNNCNIKQETVNYVSGTYSKGFDFIVGKTADGQNVLDFYVTTGDRYGSSTEPTGGSVTGADYKIRFWTATSKDAGAYYARSNTGGTFYFQPSDIHGISYALPVRCMKIQ
ncbi:MAG: hypothetical protein MJY56_00855 [Bacteroidales bacterium]|nr:hypothetical protein [Bacteroidales bacterium]